MLIKAGIPLWNFSRLFAGVWWTYLSVVFAQLARLTFYSHRYQTFTGQLECQFQRCWHFWIIHRIRKATRQLVIDFNSPAYFYRQLKIVSGFFTKFCKIICVEVSGVLQICVINSLCVFAMQPLICQWLIKWSATWLRQEQLLARCVFCLRKALLTKTALVIETVFNVRWGWA